MPSASTRCCGWAWCWESRQSPVSVSSSQPVLQRRFQSGNWTRETGTRTEGGGLKLPPPTVNTIFPTIPRTRAAVRLRRLLERQRRSMTGATMPDESSGQTCCSSSRAIAAFSATDRLRKVDPVTVSRRSISARRSMVVRAPPCTPIWTAGRRPRARRCCVRSSRRRRCRARCRRRGLRSVRAPRPRSRWSCS